MQYLLPVSVGLFLSFGVVLAVTLFLLYQTMKQQGRLLLRLDSMDERLRHLSQARNPAPLTGLSAGEAFPAFRLPDLNGKEVALEDFVGKRVLLVNWSPTCGYCVRIAAELARLRQSFAANNVQLLLAGLGDAALNRKLALEHGLGDSVILRVDAPPIQAFEGFGTPSAYLLDENGQVERPIAIGSDRVPLLARFAVGEATEAELQANSAAGKGICGQNGKQAQAGQDIPGAGPGTELKKILAKIGIGVTSDCPCNERAAAMDRQGWEWCQNNLETIVGWMREEAAKREMVFVEFGGRFLTKWAIARARRSDRKSNPSAANVIPESGARRTV